MFFEEIFDFDSDDGDLDSRSSNDPAKLCDEEACDMNITHYLPRNKFSIDATDNESLERTKRYISSESSEEDVDLQRPNVFRKAEVYMNLNHYLKRQM